MLNRSQILLLRSTVVLVWKGCCGAWGRGQPSSWQKFACFRINSLLASCTLFPAWLRGIYRFLNSFLDFLIESRKECPRGGGEAGDHGQGGRRARQRVSVCGEGWCVGGCVIVTSCGE